MPSTTGYVIQERDVPPRGDGDTATVRVTIDASVGCERLEQRVLRFGPGVSREQTLHAAEEVLYVVAGTGTLRLDGAEHALEPDTGAYVADGETWSVENPGPDELVLVAVRAPAGEPPDPARRKVIVRYADQPALPASPDREFRYLVNEDAGCLDVTQFVGVIPPGKAPLHSHTYDEVVYVVEGDGFLHLRGTRTPLTAGSCIHLPPLVMHCLENVGTTPMRVLGVFHPSGDPASRAAVANE
ncbi:MAG: cupin domain-containing protein [Actinomycetota bacterium]|nr:cupin domain-containing protein [Actinomycetota bacterium]